MARILVIRFSAIGDVAMTIPVIYSLAVQYPQHEIVVLSRAVLQPLFQGLPTNVSFVSADLKGRHKGFQGVCRLYTELKAMNFDFVADFHNVLRTKQLSFLFRLSGIPVASIRKGRFGKMRLVRRYLKILKQQKSAFQRSADALKRLGFPVELNFTSIYGEGKGDFSQIEAITGPKGDCKWIGIAPFAKHTAKIYPLPLQKRFVEHLVLRPGTRVFLFGAGDDEQALFDRWIAEYPSIVSMLGKVDLSTELNMMSHLDVMISMDSANMHLASLVNIPVVSIWGATHPYAGFMGWNQLPANVVQRHDLSCRPCSVYGQKECYRHDYDCMWEINPEEVVLKVERIINKIE